MTTLSDLRARLRVMLGDDAAAGYLWQDGTLNRHLDDAVRGYSRLLPREMAATITTVADQAEYDLPAGCERVLRVEMVEAGAEGNTPLLEGGDSYGVGYEVFAGKVVLMPAPQTAGKTAKLRYLAPHASLVNDADTSTVLVGDEDLLLLLAAAGAVQGLATEEAKRQFENRVGRSAVSTSEAFRAEFAAGVAARQSRLRPSRMVVR